MAQMIKLIDKNTKAVITSAFNTFKNLEERQKIIKKHERYF